MGKELKKETEALLKYMRFSKLLFGGSKETPQLINELKPENEFYELARKVAKDDGISWEKMTEDDSNYLILIMLNELYLAIGKRKRNLRMFVEEIINDPNEQVAG